MALVGILGKRDQGKGEFGDISQVPNEPSLKRTDLLELLDALPTYISIISPQMTVLWANSALKRALEGGVGRPCYEAYEGESGPCKGCLLERALATGRTETWIQTLRSPGIGNVQTLVQAVPLKAMGFDIPGALKVSTDITPLTSRLRQLEISQREYRALFEGSPCYISVQDRDFRIIKTNGLFRRDFGRATGRRCYEVYKGRDIKCEPCPVEKTFTDGRIHFSEETVRKRTGEPMEVVVYTAPVKDQVGQTFAVMEMSTEITQVKTLQRELASLGQAVAITAHSIKNLLMGLEGGAYVVKSALKRQDPELAQKGWEMIREGVDLASNLVRDILLISRHREPEFSEVDPSDLARQVVKVFMKKAEDLGIGLDLETPGKRTTLWCNPKAIHTALANLVANALDACASGSTFKMPRVILRVWEVEQERAICFQVQDNGPGIPKDLQEKLFKEMVTTKGASGTGLGLLVTHKIVKEHGGRILFRASSGGGAVFEVILPQRP